MANAIETLSHGTQVFCSQNHRFGTDALLLARFSLPHRSWQVADLCSGCGIVSLEWYDAGHRGPCAAVELSPEGSAQLKEALAAQDIKSITPYQADLRAFPQDAAQQGQYQLVSCNPPYFELHSGAQSACAAHAVARHENECALGDVCACAARLLKDGGRFALCHRPSRLVEVLAALRVQRLEPKRLAFVKNKAEGAPWLFLVEAQKNRKPGLLVEPDILVTAGTALYGSADANK